MHVLILGYKLIGLARCPSRTLGILNSVLFGSESVGQRDHLIKMA